LTDIIVQGYDQQLHIQTRQSHWIYQLISKTWKMQKLVNKLC